ncbi:MAG: proton-conducting transporter membrane subunit [Alphaproteobacteria bacterium]|nr:proton-conducting transporter membrane subunit [Alphaproteobacteria bacterium]
MFGLSIPLITILIPVIGSLFIIIIDRRNIIGIKAVSFWTTLFSLIFSFIPILMSKRSLNGEYEKMFSNGLLKCEVILDALSLLFVPIICLICLLCILWITKRKTQKKKSYYISILLFEALSIGAFYATNIFLIYILIESTIIPLYIIMAQKKDSTNKSIFYFLIYTMTSAILILTVFIIIYLNTNTCELREIYKLGIKSKSVFWLLALGIGIKLPIWPFYSWLPIVHVKNQTVCSILLASVVLKFSTLILLIIMMPLF